jgi:hypothetical protein
MTRVLINPPLTMSFDDIYSIVSSQPKAQTPELLTTGGVPFAASTKITKDNRRFISLPHNNRIYEQDWGYRSNSMGNDGQRIGQYSKPLDDWAKMKSRK